MEMKMLRWILGHTRLDRIRNEDTKKIMGVSAITAKLQESRLRWFSHVIRREDESVAKSALNLHVEDKRPIGRSKTRWLDKIRTDMKTAKVSPEDILYHVK